VSVERDYLAEMDARIAAATEGSGWVAAIVAEKLHAELLETDPDLLDGWLRATAADTLRLAIGMRSRNQRLIARRRAGARAFSEAAGEAEQTGDTAPLIGLFTVDYVVDAENTRKRAADMTGPEHLFVAENTYQRSANQALMLAAFHRAVAAKVGDQRTSDVFSPEQYERLYLSITRNAA
jgi:hypothetical protein